MFCQRFRVGKKYNEECFQYRSYTMYFRGIDQCVFPAFTYSQHGDRTKVKLYAPKSILLNLIYYMIKMELIFKTKFRMSKYPFLILYYVF